MHHKVKSVSFSQMKDGTAEEYAYLAKLEREHSKLLPERILTALRELEKGLSGYRINRLEHSLQCATRASRDGADTDWVVSALVHDIGDELSPDNHDAFAAAILKPYIRAECEWVVRHHGVFQLAYYGDKIGVDPRQFIKYADHPSYDAAIIFCENWDQASFDPNYNTEPLDFFEDLIREVFKRPAWDETYIRTGISVPLTTDTR
jgi:predicted HD phosphohydrolase